MYRRRQFDPVKTRLQEQRRFIQVLAGPRQSGKTTLARQIAEELRCPVRFISADDPQARGRIWMEQQWETARLQARETESTGAVLIIDEIQKIPAWSELVKRLWDEDSATGIHLKLLILGSAPLLIQKGLTESLTGRFEVTRLTHWSFTEMKTAFGWTADQYVYFGGYPGAADLIQDEDRWKRYILDAMIDTTLSRDILQLHRIDKPALLRQLFTIGCTYSGQVLSYTKLLGQLQDAGNTTTLSHYLELLGTAGMLTGLQKYAGQQIRRRGSSPKFQALNNAFLSAQSDLSFAQARRDPARWGRLVESAVGAHLVNEALAAGFEMFYWRERNREVDYVTRKGGAITALEVKSGRQRVDRSGMEEFAEEFRPERMLLIGTGGIPLSEFLSEPVSHWIA